MTLSEDLSPLSAPHFVATKSEKEIAGRLREDEALIDTGKPCSWIAWHLTGYETEKGFAIATQLAPDPSLSHDIKCVIYENLLTKIRRHLKSGRMHTPLHKTGREGLLKQDPLRSSELATALKVLAHLEETSIIQRDTPAETIISWLKQQVAPQQPAKAYYEDSVYSHEKIPSNIPKPPQIPHKRQCYICRLALIHPHPTQPSMCITCGAFNLASSLLSTPPKLSLPSTFTALVTGARINLGYHTALRLLRCGARVIATTRYPNDAVSRYLQEIDSNEWKERLKVVGADFRCAADAFALVGETRRCLTDWADGEEMKLHLLVNNAAQTLTDSVQKEEHAVRREEVLRKRIESDGILIEGTYKVRVRGEAVPMALGSTESVVAFEHVEEGVQSAITVTSHGSHNLTQAEVEPYSKSSWVQSLFEIPYEDVISAHAVNTFVPLILCRELLPLMGSTTSGKPPMSTNSSAPTLQTLSTRPKAYVINVSSREGIFEDRINSTAKRGKHVHTNMSKAALNMITETEAATAWRSRRVAINTVDPGYMSAAPEYEDAYNGVRPIGWEDGAGRVLWPIAVGEMEGQVIYGRFLKHYGAIEVDPGAGRG